MHTAARTHAPRVVSPTAYRRIVALWCARRSHVAAPRVYAPHHRTTTLRIDSPRVFNPSVTIPATSATFTRARAATRDRVLLRGTCPPARKRHGKRYTASDHVVFAGDPWTLLVVVVVVVDSAADSAHSTSERTGAADSPRLGLALPSAARSSPPRRARRALVTPTYSPPRTLPRSSSWCFHSSSQPPPPAYPCICIHVCDYGYLRAVAGPLLPPTRLAAASRVCVYSFLSLLLLSCISLSDLSDYCPPS